MYDISFRNDLTAEIKSFVERRFTYNVKFSSYWSPTALLIKSAPSINILVSRDSQQITLMMNGIVAHSITLSLSNPLMFSEIEKFICAAPKYKFSQFKAESNGS